MAGTASSRCPAAAPPSRLDEVEISILRSLAVQLLELIGPGDEPADGDDPLAALFAEGPSEPPTDPALARLFPDAYGDAGRQRRWRARPGRPRRRLRAASAEFRRYTENDLRARKREDALAVIRSLDALATAAPADGASAAEAGDRGVPAVARRAQRPAADHRHPA